MFTEEDGTIINNEKSKVFVRIQLKVSTLAFEAGDFNIFLRFWGFKAHFLIKKFLIKNVYKIENQ